MKAIFKTTTVMAFIFTAAVGMANESATGPKGVAVEHLTKKENTRPVFRKKGDVVYMNLLNLDLEKVNIKVYDSEKRLLFSEVVEGKLIVEKAFNFKKAVEDSYTIVVKDSEGTYSEKLLVN